MKITIKSERGLSLVEVTLMVMVLSILSAVMSPAIGDYVNDARRVKAASDVQVLAATFARFAFDTNDPATKSKDWRALEMLVGDGQSPTLGQGGDAEWLGSPDNQRVGLLDEHLLTNGPGYPSRDGMAFWCRGWRGPYLSTGIGPDPWGHRYAVNVGSWSTQGADIVVISAGGNGSIETPFQKDGLTSGGDDIVAQIGSGGR
jgi:type II secretory pathway pseudopilin PulG